MKRHSNIQSIISSLLLSIICMCGITSNSFAATVVSPETGDATIKISNYLMTSQHVTLPSIKFSYDYEKLGLFLGTEIKKESTQPDLINIGSDNGDVAFSSACAEGENINGYQTYTLMTDNIIPSGSSFPHAGEYLYSITQNVDENEDYDASLTYSQAEYKMHVFVANTANGLRVASAYVEILTDNEGKDAEGKVEVDELETPAYRNNDFGFTNYFLPNDQTLTITNNITGDYSDLTKKFSMTLLINNPSYVASDETRKYYGVVVDSATMKPDSESKVEFVSGTEKKFYLKHGQQLVFVNSEYSPNKDVAITDADQQCLPGGLGYSASFGATNGYLPKGTVTHGGIKESTQTGTSGEKLTLSVNAYVDMGLNSSDFEASYRDVVVTGINENVFPFAFVMLLILIASAAKFASVRRKDN